MNSKSTITILTGILAIAMISTTGYSQNHFSGLRKMSPMLNSADNDQSAVISPTGLSLYFQSQRSGGHGGSDIYVSQRAALGSAWGTPQNLGATVNSSNLDGIGAFSLDGRTMFLQSQRSDSGGLGGNDLYMSTRTDPNDDFGWTAPVNITVANSASNELSGTYFEDPATGAGTLIFSSDRVGTPGISFHFYQSTRNPDGTFNPPTLIPELNSEGAEFGAGMTRDGLQVFFGSSRAGGLGPPPGTGLPPTFDIFVSTRASVSAPWDPPVLVPGVNTPGDERIPKLSPDGSILYLTSNRAGGVGLNDLYSATRCSLYSDSPCGVNRTVSDFNGDGITDISVFRPSDGTWWVMESGTNTVSVRQFGASGDKIVPGDYDGDGRTDMAVFRPSEASWWILNSSDGSYSVTQFGLSTDKLVPADYDGDTKTNIASYRDGTWYIRQPNGEIRYQQFGLSTDIPVAE